jgi:tetratricopeptide (TPR) repeat protein
MKALATAIVLALALPGLAAAGPSDAQQIAAAKAFFKKGKELYNQARYREAIAAFEAAYKAKPHGVLHYNIAQCHEKLGDIPAALRSYHEYLREVPDADDKENVLKAMSNLEARLAATGVQQLLVYSDPAEAEVWVDGQSRGRTPFSTVLPHGTHTVSLVKTGYKTVTREVVLAPDRSLELSLTLVKGASAVPLPPPPALPAAPPAAATSPAPGASPLAATPPAAGKVAAPPVPISPAPPEPVKRELKKGKLWTWIAGGVAVAAAGAGAYYGMKAQQASDDLRSGSYVQPKVDALQQDAKTAQRNANVLYGVAGAAAAAGVTLFFIEGSF